MTQTWLPEGYIAISFIQNGEDEYNRETVWNHTMLLTVEDYFKLHRSVDNKLFESHFIREMQNPYGTLKPLKVETK